MQNTPIIDLKERLNIHSDFHHKQNRVIITSLRKLQVDLLVDVATDVLDLNCSVIESTPQWLSKLNEKLFEGVVKLEDELLI